LREREIDRETETDKGPFVSFSLLRERERDGERETERDRERERLRETGRDTRRGEETEGNSNTERYDTFCHFGARELIFNCFRYKSSLPLLRVLGVTVEGEWGKSARNAAAPTYARSSKSRTCVCKCVLVRVCVCVRETKRTRERARERESECV